MRLRCKREVRTVSGILSTCCILEFGLNDRDDENRAGSSGLIGINTVSDIIRITYTVSKQAPLKLVVPSSRQSLRHYLRLVSGWSEDQPSHVLEGDFTVAGTP